MGTQQTTTGTWESGVSHEMSQMSPRCAIVDIYIYISLSLSLYLYMCVYIYIAGQAVRCALAFKRPASLGRGFLTMRGFGRAFVCMHTLLQQDLQLRLVSFGVEEGKAVPWPRKLHSEYVGHMTLGPRGPKYRHSRM